MLINVETKPEYTCNTLSKSFKKELVSNIQIHTHTHTHTHMYIYKKKMSWEWLYLEIYKNILINLKECSMYDD